MDKDKGNESETITADKAEEKDNDLKVTENVSSTGTGIVGPPSPLTGCYLMIILAEPNSDHHKDILIQRLIKG